MILLSYTVPQSKGTVIEFTFQFGDFTINIIDIKIKIKKTNLHSNLVILLLKNMVRQNHPFNYLHFLLFIFEDICFYQYITFTFQFGDFTI